jgi:MoxR-like ATPase
VCLSLDDLYAAHAVVDAVKVSDDMVTLFIQEILGRLYARKEGAITVSDRRKKKCWKLIKARAFIDGRTEVSPSDLNMLRYCLWTKPTEIEAVETLLEQYKPIALDDAKAIEDNVRRMYATLKGASLDSKKFSAARDALLGKINEGQTELLAYESRCVGDAKAFEAIKQIRDNLTTIQKEIFVHDFGAAPTMFRV